MVVDGQPGSAEQINYWREAGLLDRLEGVVVLEVPEEESIRRLSKRGRDDDNLEVWQRKFRHYEQKICSFLAPVKEAKIPVYYIDGVGSPEDVLKRICGII